MNPYQIDIAITEHFWSDNYSSVALFAGLEQSS
jgi:hypothetical protein